VVGAGLKDGLPGAAVVGEVAGADEVDDGGDEGDEDDEGDEGDEGDEAEPTGDEPGETADPGVPGAVPDAAVVGAAPDPAVSGGAVAAERDAPAPVPHAAANSTRLSAAPG